MKNQQLVKDVKFCKCFLSNQKNTILSSIAFNKDNMYCTNNDVTINFKTKLNSQRPFLIDANTLEKILSKQKDFEIDIDETINLILKNNSKISLAIDYENINSFPEISKAKKDFCVLNEKGINNLKNIVYSASTDTIKPIFNAVYFHKTCDGIVAVATDSRRLAKTLISTYTDAPDSELIIPLNTIKLVLKLKPKNIVIKIEKESNSKYCSFICDDRVTITTRLYDGTYVNYNHAIPVSDKTLIRVIDRKDFVEVIEQALTVTTKPAYKSTWYVSKDNIAVEVKDPEGVNFNGQIENKTPSTETLKLKINTHFVLETLKNMSTDKINVMVTGPMSPIKFCDDEVTAVIMPIQLKPV